MKTNSLTKILSAAAVIAMVSASSSVFAQVKIGSNPATIGSSSNLEVEATNGKKVIVDKATGSMTIQNAPIGTSSDSILTADPSGLVRKVGSSTLKQNLGISGAFRDARTQSNQTLGTDVTAVVIFDTESYDENNEMDPASGVFTVSQTGTWLLQSKEVYTVNTTSNSNGLYIERSTDGGVTWRTVVQQGMSGAAPGYPYTLNVTYVDYSTAGTKYRVKNTTCNGCSPNTYVFTEQSFIGTRIR